MLIKNINVFISRYLEVVIRKINSINTITIVRNSVNVH